MTDFVDIIGSLSNFVQNERVAAHNEAVDEVIDAIRAPREVKHHEQG